MFNGAKKFTNFPRKPHPPQSCSCTSVYPLIWAICPFEKWFASVTESFLLLWISARYLGLRMHVSPLPIILLSGSRNFLQSSSALSWSEVNGKFLHCSAHKLCSLSCSTFLIPTVLLQLSTGSPPCPYP